MNRSDIAPVATDADVVDPLSLVGRKERTALLICNLFLFAVYQINIIPTKISLAGVEFTKINSTAIKTLIWVLLAYYSLSFAMTIGAEHQAWKSKLDGLRRRRQLYAETELEESLDNLREMHERREGSVEPDRLQLLRSNYTASFNAAQQKDWRQYKHQYEVRMYLDGYLPLALTFVNAAAAIYSRL